MTDEAGATKRALRLALVLAQVGCVLNAVCFWGFFGYLTRVRPASPHREFTIDMSHRGNLIFVSIFDVSGLVLLAVLAVICLILGLWAQAMVQRMAGR